MKGYKFVNEELEHAKSSLAVINEMMDIKSNPVVDSVLMPVIKAVPVIGEMIDSSMDKAIDNFQKKKEQELIEVILRDKHTITSEMVNDVEFIVNFAKTKEIVCRLASNEKVKYFGNLIRNGYLSGTHISNSEFEEYLDLLNTMSYREIQYLVFLKEHPIGKKDITSWGKFEQLFREQFEQEEENPYSIYLRIKRTGFVEEEFKLQNTTISKDSVGDYELDWDEIESDCFFVSEAFNRFCKMILDDG